GEQCELTKAHDGNEPEDVAAIVQKQKSGRRAQHGENERNRERRAAANPLRDVTVAVEAEERADVHRDQRNADPDPKPAADHGRRQALRNERRAQDKTNQVEAEEKNPPKAHHANERQQESYDGVL